MVASDRLAFAPTLGTNATLYAKVTAILDGQQPATLSARQLLREPTMPLCWQEQRQLLGLRAYP
jgi:hypothetical protein